MSADPAVAARAGTVDRHLDFGTVFNFRDLGGYPAHDGRRTKWRTLFRADGLHRMDADDVERFGELGIATVLDLRTPGELEERGRFVGGHDTGWRHLPVLDAIWAGEGWPADLVAAEFLADRYLEMLDVGRASLADAIHLVADSSNLPLVFHCAAGKDRTGVLAALVLGLLGVDHATIAHDYSLSGAGMDRMRAWIQATFPEATERMASQPAAFMAAPAEAMERFLSGVGRHHGSIEAYCADIGVDDAVVAALRATLLD